MEQLTLAIAFQGIDKLSPVTSRIQGNLGRIGSAISGASKRMGDMGTRLSIQGGFLEAGAKKMQSVLRGVIGPGMELDTAAAKLRTMPGIAEASVNRIVAAGRRWSAHHTNSAQDYVQTSYMMLSAGLNEQASIAAAGTAMTVATATMGEHTDAANLLATIYNNLGDKTRPVEKEMTRLGDVITKTQQTFQFANFSQLTEGMKYGIPVAIKNNMTLEETAAIIGQLNNAGLQGSQAGTSFAAAMASMGRASEQLGFEIVKSADGGVDFIATLQDIKEMYGDLSELSDEEKMQFQSAFGQGGERAITLLSASLGELEANLVAVRDNAGAASKAQKAMEDSLEGQTKILQNNLDALRLDFARELVPELRKAIPEIKKFIGQVREFVEKHPDAMKQIAKWALVGTAILTVVAPIVTITGTIVTLGSILLSIPGKFGALKQGGSLITRFAKVVIGLGGKALPPLLNIIKMAGSIFARFGLRVLGIATRVLPFLINAIRMVGMAFMANPIGLVITGIAIGAALLIANWDKVGPYFAKLWDWIKEKAAVVWDWMKEVFFNFHPLGLIIKHWEPLKKFFTNLWDGIKTAFSAAWDWITDRIAAPIKALKESLGSAWNKVSGWLGGGGSDDAEPGSSGSSGSTATVHQPLMAAGAAGFTMSAEFNIYASAGQSPTDVGRAVRAEIENWLREQGRRGRSALHDGGVD